MTIIHDFINELFIRTGISTVILPSAIFMVLVYVFLSRSKIIESKIVSLILSFLVFLLLLTFPILSGIDVSAFLSTFFLQSFFVSLVFLLGLLLSSLFYADFSKVLEKFQGSRAMIVIFISIISVIFITSGALTLLIETIGGPKVREGDIQGLENNFYNKTEISKEVSFTLAALILLLVLAVIIVGIGRMMLKET